MSKREQLYDNLIKSGKVSTNEIGTKEQFVDALSSEDAIREFHKNLSSVFSAGEIGSADDFYGSVRSDLDEEYARSLGIGEETIKKAKEWLGGTTAQPSAQQTQPKKKTFDDVLAEAKGYDMTATKDAPKDGVMTSYVPGEIIGQQEQTPLYESRNVIGEQLQKDSAPKYSGKSFDEIWREAGGIEAEKANATTTPQVPQEYADTFGEGIAEGSKALGYGMENLAAEGLRLVTGSQSDYDMAIDMLSHLRKMGVNPNEVDADEIIDLYNQSAEHYIEEREANKEGRTKYPDGVDRRSMLDQIDESVNLFSPTKAKKIKASRRLAQALKDANGDMDKAKDLLIIRSVDKNEETVADRWSNEAREGLRNVKETKGFGAWVGNLLPQMAGNALALTAAVVTKKPQIARAIGLGNTAMLTASTAGSSMATARDYADTHKGVSEGDIWRAGIVDGGIEYLTEKIPLDMYLGNVLNKATKQTGLRIAGDIGKEATDAELDKLLKSARSQFGGRLLTANGIKQYLAQVGTEGASEFMAGVLQTLSPMIYQNPEDYPTLLQSLEDGWEGAKAGFFMGAFLGGGSTVIANRQQRARRKAQGHVYLADAGDQGIVEIVGYNEDGTYQILDTKGKESSISKDALNDITTIAFDSFDKGRVVNDGAVAKAQGTQAETPQEVRRVGKSLSEAQSAIIGINGGESIKSAIDNYIADGAEDISSVSAVLDGLSESDREVAEDYFLARTRMQSYADKVQEIIDDAVSQEEERLAPYIYGGDSELEYDANGDIVRDEDGNAVERTTPRIFAEAVITPVNAHLKDEEPYSVMLTNYYPDSPFVTYVDANGVPQMVKRDDANIEVVEHDYDEYMAEYRAKIEADADARADIMLEHNEQTNRAMNIGETIETLNGQMTVLNNDGQGNVTLAPVQLNSKGETEVVRGSQPVTMSAREAMALQDEYYERPTEVVDNAQSAVDNMSANQAQNEGISNRENEQNVSKPTREPIPTVQNGKKSRVAYEQVPVARTIEEVYGQFDDQEEVDEFIDLNIAEAETAVKNASKPKPKMSTDIEAYKQAKAKWQEEQAGLAEAQKRLDYWKEVKAESERMQGLDTLTDIPQETKKDDNAPRSAMEYVASMIGRLDPESYRRETGYGVKEQRKAGPIFLKKENGGMTVEGLAEWICEQPEAQEWGIQPGMDSEVRDMIIEVLSHGSPKAYIRDARAQQAKADAYGEEQYLENMAAAQGFASADDMIAHDEVFLAEAIRRNYGLDDNEYYANLAEEYEQEDNRRYGQGNERQDNGTSAERPGQGDTTAEVADVSGSSEVLSEEQSADTTGTESGNEQGELSRSTEGGNESIAENEAVRGESVEQEPSVAPEQQAVVERVGQWEQQLGVKVNVITDASEVADETVREQLREKKEGDMVKGWFDPKTGEAYVYLPDNHSVEDVDETIIHEVVAHKGLRGLLGKAKFNKLCDAVWRSMSARDKARFLSYVDGKVGNIGDQRAAADEYIAHLAERMDKAELTKAEKGIWQTIVDFIMDALEKVGIKVTDKQIEALIKASYANMVSKASQNADTKDLLEYAQRDVERRAVLRKKKAPETVSVQKEHLQSVVSSADGAKVLKNIDSAIKKYEKDANTKEKTFIGNIAEALGAKRQGSGSQYATFETVNGKVVTIRLADHNAKVSNFDNKGEKDGISIVITPKKNEGVTNDGDAHIVEYFYDAIKLRRADGKPLVEILKSIKQSLYSGEYKDTTGLAQVEEVNKPLFRKKKDANNLIAVHNLSESNLRKVLEMGGLIMPSIAVTDVNLGHSGYGEITLLFDKETINPSDRRNKVYGGDAWTPRFPKMEPKLNGEVVRSVRKKIEGLLDENLRAKYSLSAELHPSNIESTISNNGVEGYYGKEWMKIAYLLDNGKRFKIPMKMKDYGSMAETIIKLAKDWGLSLSEIRNGGYEFYEKNPEFVAAVLDAKNEARLASVSAEDRDKVRELLRNRPMRFNAFDTYISQAMDMERDLNNGGLKQVIDGMALYEAINKRVKTDNADYNKWVDDLFEGVVEKYGIRNNRDWYTPSGNSRPWEQLYDAPTPANILRYMLAQNDQGGNGGLWDSNIMGASAETYESIEEIREKGKKRLHKVSEDVYDEWATSVANRFSEICDEFMTASQKNDFGHIIDAKIAITNAVGKDKTAKGIYKTMKKQYANFTMEHAKQVEEIVKEIQDYATTYFEAKPQRVVELSEVRKAVVPSNVSSDIVEGLKKNGIEVATYRKGNEQSRNRVVKKESEGIRFRKANRNQVGFVSNAMVAVENVKQDKATPEQWLKMIEKQGGLKASEDKWLGLSDWLKSSDKKTLTKDEVLEFIGENMIQIEEVTYKEDAEADYADKLAEFNAEFDELIGLGEEETESIYTSDWVDYAWSAMVERYGDDFESAFEVEGNGTNARLVPQFDYDGSLMGAARYFLDIEEESNPINSTRLDYTTDGLENKREIALTVPTIESWNESDEIHFGDAGEGRAVAWVRFGETTVYEESKELKDAKNALEELKEKYDGQLVRNPNMTKEDEKLAKELNKKIRELLLEGEAGDKRVLVIDEIQSKRHQEGREKGYRDAKLERIDSRLNALSRSSEAEIEEATRLSSERYSYIVNKLGPDAIAMDEELTALMQRNKELVEEKKNEENERLEIIKLNDELDKVRNVRDYDRIDAEIKSIENRIEQRENERKEILERIEEIDSRLNKLINDYVREQRYGVSSAPFEKNWHELAMKRMLRLAAEEGFDKVAWTTGAQQAERYDIGDAVKNIEVNAVTDSETGEVLNDEFDVYTRSNANGGGFIPEATGRMSTEQIMEVFGKDLGGRIVENGRTQKNAVIEGENLRLGGDGMKGFYDKMLPSFVQKYTKKWGAKVGEVTLPNLEESAQKMWSVDVTPQMKESVGEQVMFRKKPAKIEAEEAKHSRPVRETNDTNDLLEYAKRDVERREGTRFSKRTTAKEGVDAYTKDFKTDGINITLLYSPEDYYRYAIDVLGANEEEADEFVELVKENKIGGIFLSGTNEIALFADNIDNAYSVLFHEHTHLAVEKLGDINRFAELASELSVIDEELADRIGQRYRSEDIEKEVIAYSLQYALEGGAMSELRAVLSDNSKALLDNLLNYIGYDTGKDYKKEVERQEKREGSNLVKRQQRTRNQVRRFSGLRGSLLEEGSTPQGLVEESAKKEGGLKGFDALAYAQQKVKEREDEVKFRRMSVELDKAEARRAYESMLDTESFRFQEAFQDSMLGLKALQDAVVKANGKSEVSDWENAYMAENQLSSINHTEQEAWRRLVLGKLLGEVKSLMKEGATHSEISDYLMAKHGLERNEKFADRDAREVATDKDGNLDMAAYQNELQKNREEDYSGLTTMFETEDVAEAERLAREFVNQFEQDHDTQNLWSAVKGATKSILDKQLKSGLISKETYDLTDKMFEWYVPLRGFDETTSDEVYDYLDKGSIRSTLSMPIRHAKGRGSKADDPIATIANMAESGIMAGNKNVMKQKFLNLVENNPTDLVSVDDVWVEKRFNPSKGEDEWVQVLPDYTGLTTAEEIEQARATFEASMEARHKADPKSVLRGREAEKVPYKVVTSKQMNEHQVVVKRGGKTYVLTINGNPRAAQALNGLTNPHGSENPFIQETESLNRWLASMFTSRNPAFIFANLVRDGIYANQSVWAKESAAYAIKYNQNWNKALASLPKLIKLYKQNNLDLNNPEHKMFYDFITNGGETGYSKLTSVEEYKKHIGAELGEGKRDVLEVLDKGLDTFNRWAEGVSRYSAFKTSREMGRSVQRSIYDAKEISVNFNKKGAGASVAGKYNIDESIFSKNNRQVTYAYASQGARMLYVFWNAGVQGLTNFGKIAKKNPKKFLAWAGTQFVAGACMPLINSVLVSMFGDDDDDYWNIPEYIRRNNVCIFDPVTGGYIKIPMPIELRAIYGLGELMAGQMLGKTDFKGMELTKQVVGQVSQILPIDMMEGEGGLMAFVPSYVKPIAEILANKDWTGIPLKKDYDYNKNMPEWTKAYKGTNPWLVGLSEAVNDWTGGNKHKKGAIDIDPSAVQHLFEGYFGGVGKMISQTFDTASLLWSKDMREGWTWGRNAPIINRFYTSSDKRAEEKRITSDWWRHKDEMDIVGQQYNGFKRDMKTKDAVEYAKAKEELRKLMESDEYGQYVMWKEYDKKLNKLNEALKKDVNNEELKERKIILQENMNEIFKKAE